MSLFLYILVLGMWSKVLGTCLCLERLTLYVFISVHIPEYTETKT